VIVLTALLVNSITPVRELDNLWALEIDANAVGEDFKKEHEEEIKKIAKRGTYFDRQDVADFYELAIPGLDEIMAIIEISKLLKEGQYDLIVLDTAPTGHTLSGDNDTTTFSGTYDGALEVQDTYKVFRVKITTGGAVDTAQYSWYKPGNDGITPDGTAVVTSGTPSELSNGVYIAFAAATYVVDDEWSVLVDVFPYNYETTKGLTITPSVIHAASGVTTGITAGTSVLVSGTAATSDAETIMTADPNYGLGDYYIDVDLSQIIHSNSLVGEYTSVATITVS